MTAETCWVLSDGKAGIENLSLGLAEAVGLATTVKRVQLRAPWTLLPPQLWLAPFSAPGPGSDPLAPPWPDLLIAAGRLTVALSIAIKRASGDRCFTVQLLNPRVDPANFDLVVAPRHDELAGANVINIVGALNRVTPARLAQASEAFAEQVAHLPQPRIAVLIGGASMRHRFDEADANALGERLAGFARTSGAGLMVATSHRTGAANTVALRAKLDGVACEMWDGTGKNPYFGYLAIADAIVVTNDSVAMASEACATGKPVYVAELPGGSIKFERFHGHLREAGYTRPFTDAVAASGLETWHYKPLGETRNVADEIRMRMGLGRAVEVPSVELERSMDERKYWSADYFKGLSPQELSGLAPSLQRDVMRHWFFQHYEDPAENTPFESAEGGYIYTWGGPHDAQEVLETEFSPVVPGETIQVLVAELEVISTKWSSVPDDHEFDTENIEASTTDREAALRTIANNFDGFLYIDSPLNRLDPTRAEKEREQRQAAIARLAELEECLQNVRPADSLVGHNDPPEELRPAPYDQEVHRRIVASISQIKTELQFEIPDPESVAHATAFLQRVVNALKPYAEMTAEAASKAFGKTLGTAIALAIPAAVAALLMHLTGAIEALQAWLKLIIP